MDIKPNMTADLKPYPHYKPSGVEWLGDVPAHWEVRRLKFSVENVSDQTRKRREREIYLAMEHVESWTGKYREAGPDVVFDSQVKRFKAGDVLFGKLRPYLAKVTRPNRPGVCVGEFLVLRPRARDMSPAYLEYLMRSKPVIDAINASTFGAKMPRADWQFIGGMVQPIPPLPEQAAIVRYLDHTVGRIVRYLRSRERLIELLEEYRQAVVQEAVTQGLDPDVPSKPSGVEWLGDVPAHWDVAAVKRYYSIQLGKMLQNFPNSPKDVEVPYLKVQHVQWFSVRTTDVPTMWASPYEMEQFGIRAGDLLVCEGGEGGRCALVEEVPPGYIIQNALHRVRTLGTSRNDYLQYVMSAISRAGWFDAINNKATIAHFTVEKFRSLKIPIPPLAEQAAIAAYLDEQTAAVDAAMARARREIELLTEYRTRLIADVVTGQVDVRGAAELSHLGQGDSTNDGGEGS